MQGVLLRGGEDQHYGVTADRKRVYSYSAGGACCETVDKNPRKNQLPRRVRVKLPDMS